MKNYFHPHYVDCLFKILVRRFWTIVNYISARYWRVSIGTNVRFNGKTYFNILPGAHVSIGSRCSFNSSFGSNLIGVYSPCIVSTQSAKASIQIGNACGFSGTVIASALSVTIGDNVRCGANTLIMDTDWHTDDCRAGKDAAVVIEDNVWLGYGVKVLKGVRIGKNSLIGACSVVTKDVPSNVIACGNPCKVVKRII